MRVFLPPLPEPEAHGSCFPVAPCTLPEGLVRARPEGNSAPTGSGFGRSRRNLQHDPEVGRMTASDARLHDELASELQAFRRPDDGSRCRWTEPPRSSRRPWPRSPWAMPRPSDGSRTPRRRVGRSRRPFRAEAPPSARSPRSRSAVARPPGVFWGQPSRLGRCRSRPTPSLGAGRAGDGRATRGRSSSPPAESSSRRRP